MIPQKTSVLFIYVSVCLYVYLSIYLFLSKLKLTNVNYYWSSDFIASTDIHKMLFGTFSNNMHNQILTFTINAIKMNINCYFWNCYADDIICIWKKKKNAVSFWIVNQDCARNQFPVQKYFIDTSLQHFSYNTSAT